MGKGILHFEKKYKYSTQLLFFKIMIIIFRNNQIFLAFHLWLILRRQILFSYFLYGAGCQKKAVVSTDALKGQLI